MSAARLLFQTLVYIQALISLRSGSVTFHTWWLDFLGQSTAICYSFFFFFDCTSPANRSDARMHLTEIQVRFNESITNEFACSVGSAPRLFQSKSLQQKNRCIRLRAHTFSRERQMLKSRDLLEVPYTEGNKKTSLSP